MRFTFSQVGEHLEDLRITKGISEPLATLQAGHRWALGARIAPSSPGSRKASDGWSAACVNLVPIAPGTSMPSFNFNWWSVAEGFGAVAKHWQIKRSPVVVTSVGGKGSLLIN